jgi:predicted cupin superfamily sugar epimerase
MSDEAAHLIDLLGLQPHPEGGHYREIFRDPSGHDGRAHSTAIYFLLCSGEISRWHRVDAVEIWHFYRGGPLELSVAGQGSHTVRHMLGSGIERGECPQIVVPAQAWQSARSLGAFTLVGCTVAPGFEFAKFEMAPEGFEP